MTRCSVIIPVHNGAELTERCLEAIAAHPPTVDCEIVVVDDASSDGSGARLSRLSGVRLVQRAENGGFARACNDGAAAASGELLVFLNNDTEPHAGWLDALVDHYDSHSRVGAVGSKLLFPDGTVQHAGVVFGQDGFPRHAYNGFPGSHAAVNRPRTFQAVTAACLLVERARFLDMGGFDHAFRNGMEDVDLCLRLRETGVDVHYCPSSVLTHLESVTRGRNTAEIRDGIRLFRSRWEDRILPDDLACYQEDGLLRVGYRDMYPIEIEIDPRLGVVTGEHAAAADRLLLERSGQITDLLRDVVELSVALSRTGSDASAQSTGTERTASDGATDAVPDGCDLDGAIEQVMTAIHDLQLRLASSAHGAVGLPTSRLTYRQRVRDVQRAIRESVPSGSTVLVVSRGDDALVGLNGFTGWHFPRATDGRYAGHYPADCESAVRHLEELRDRGARYLVIPEDSHWWLDHYPGLRAHLEEHGGPAQADGCLIFALASEEAHAAVP